MKKTALIISLSMIGSQFACSLPKANDTDKTVSDFVNLLVSDKVISLSDYEKFYGQSSEQELFFELRECEERGWNENSKNCISFVRERRASPKSEKSLFINWLKEKFLTSGKDYEVISSSSSVEGFEHSLIEVMVGEHKFILFLNKSLDKKTGLLMGISSVDDRNIQSYFPIKGNTSLLR